AAEGKPHQRGAIGDRAPGREIVTALDSDSADKATFVALPVETQCLDGVFQGAGVQQITPQFALGRTRFSLAVDRHDGAVRSSFDAHVQIFELVTSLTVHWEHR